MPANKEFLATVATHEPLDILASSLETEPSTSIRINPVKIVGPEELEMIAPLVKKRVAWCPDGYTLASRPRFTFDPAMHQGLYYAQDSSSMAISAAIDAALEELRREKISGEEIEPKIGGEKAGREKLRYLDLCAAPGGKTTAAIAALPKGSIVAANEYDFKRAEILAENVGKWGAPGVIVTRGDTSQYAKLPGYFNIVAVDAPCSGEGMMRKDAKAAEQWSIQLVRECAKLQQEILDNAWTALSPGGFLIYSTCTFNTIENEGNVRHLIDNFEAAPLKIKKLESAAGVKPGIDCDFPCYRFIPGHVEGEGQFIALLQKPYSASADKRAKKAGSKGRKGGTKASAPAPWLKGEWRYWQKGDEIYGSPASMADDICLIADKTDAICPGMQIGTIKGRDIAPSQALAMCADLGDEAFPRAELSYEQAIAYLQRQAPDLGEAPKGIVLLTYRGHPLGFAKNLGNRANNLYPKEWRIISNA
ncbi:MAG: RsmB/NOP family class I SAM-dependent RNA methyltransferase [Clostridium sp.]|nr:RsmB/NOP family class I SAM-dependent RNA methyltransferase [Clostridium sp.]